MSATDADRATAERLMREVYRSPLTGDPLVRDAIAEALAAEREKARAPFLALADWVQRERPKATSIRDRVVVSTIVNRIFNAAEDAQ